MDKLDKNRPGKGQALLVEQGISQAAAQEILRFIAITGSNAQVLAALEAYQGGRNQVFDQGLEELGLVVKYLASFGVPRRPFCRGPHHGGWTTQSMRDRHRSPAPSAPAAGTTTWRSITPTKLPGVGISIGLTRLFYVLGEQGYLNDGLVTSPPG